MALLACSAMTGDLNRQLKISAHIAQSASLRGCDAAHPPGADHALGEEDRKRYREQNHGEPLQKWMGNEVHASGRGFPRGRR